MTGDLFWAQSPVLLASVQTLNEKCKEELKNSSQSKQARQGLDSLGAEELFANTVFIPVFWSQFSFPFSLYLKTLSEEELANQERQKRKREH